MSASDPRNLESRLESALESRVAQLERQLLLQRRQQRRLPRTLAVAALLGLVAVLTLGATRGPPDVVRARRFEVLDERGRALVTLRTTDFGGHVQTLGRDGVSGVSIGASSNGGFVGVRDGKPSYFPRVELSTDDTGGMLAVRNWGGFAIEVDRNGLAVAHTQEDGNFTRVDARVELGVSEHGGHIRVRSATGEQAAVIQADPSGSGLIRALGAGGKESVLKPER